MSDELMWSGDPLDETLREAAARYHEPGPVPREAMWARIRAVRAAGGGAAGGGAAGAADSGAPQDGPRVIALPFPTRGVRRWPRLAASAAALAAALLVGIAIGRQGRVGPEAGTAAGAGAPAGSTRVADAPAAVSAGSPTAGATDAAPAGGAPVMVAERPGEAPSPRTGPATGASAPDGADAGAGAERGAGHGTDARAAEPALSYRLAAIQHMSRAEALLTTFRVGARRGQLDEGIQPWARDLLSSTRLLLDSPAGADAEMGALLSDLELVLAQIVQLSAQRRAAEVELIDRQLDADGVITRLRTAVPSGTLARGA